MSRLAPSRNSAKSSKQLMSSAWLGESIFKKAVKRFVGRFYDGFYGLLRWFLEAFNEGFMGFQDLLRSFYGCIYGFENRHMFQKVIRLGLRD